MKKSEKIVLISILSLLTILVVFFVVMGFASCQTAYADYEDLNGNEILNFNQYIQINSATNENNKFTPNSITVGENILSRVNITQFTLLANHKYYLKTNVQSQTMFYLGNAYNQYYGFYERIIMSGTNETVNSIVISASATLDTEFYFSIIDLTQMFNGNEPTLAQCQALFTSKYYIYTTGTAITLNGLNGYEQGVQSVYKSMQYKLTASHVYNTAYAYEGELTNQTWTYNNQTVIATAINDGILAIPLGSVIEQGKTLQIYSGYIGFCLNNANGDNGLGYLCWACRYNDSFIPMYIGGTAESANNDGYLTLSAPYAMDTIYLLESWSTNYISQPNNRSFGVFNTTITVPELDASALVDNAYNNGYDAGVKSFEQGGTNYMKIYNKGVSDAQTNSAVFADSWSFMASAFEGVGTLLAVELIPNIPLGLFVAFPLLLGLIFFIVKITKGGD